MKSTKSLIAIVLLFTGILVFVNLLSERYFTRIDLTSDKQFTLSKATEEILESLTEPVTVKAYFSEDLPPQVAKVKKDFLDLLVEYANLSEGKVLFEFINPNKDEETENEALQNGVSPVLINVREKDQVKQQKTYLGALVEMGEIKDVIAVLQPGAAMEYALSTSIKKLSVVDKPAIGFLQGHGEPAINELQQVQMGLSILYNMEEVKLTDTSSIPEKFQTIAIIAPKDSFSQNQINQLDDFLKRGGNIFLAINRVDGDLQNSTGLSVSTGLEAWLENKGLVIEDGFVLDANCGAVTVQQQRGGFRFQNQVSFPYLPIVNNFSEHPITKGLESVILQFASPISFKGDSSLGFQPLAYTSEKSASENVPLRFNIAKNWSEADFNEKGLVVGAILEGDFGGDKPAKLVVFSDGDFAVNGDPSQGRAQNQDNISLLVNSIDWLSDDTGLIELRTKGVATRPLEQLEENTRTLLKFVNFLLPVILVLIYGVIRAQMRRGKRNRRMNEDYEHHTTIKNKEEVLKLEEV